MTRKKLTASEAKTFASEVLGFPVICAIALPSNGSDRHWNYKIIGHSQTVLLRIENSLAVEQRTTWLKDEAKLVRIFSKYSLAPRLLQSGKRNGKTYIVEEWIDAPSIPKRLSKVHLKKLAEFLARVNAVPFRRYARALNWKSDRLDYVSRREMIEKRLRTGTKVTEFRKAVRSARPRLEKGLQTLQKEIVALPKSALQPILSYRDIGPGNIFAAKPNYLAVDWEWHSVGVSDPSFSLVVLARRFQLMPKLREFLIQEYLRNRYVPHLRELMRVRELERILGEATWPLAWVARRIRLPLPGKDKQKKNALKQLAKSLRELDSFLKTTSPRT